MHQCHPLSCTSCAIPSLKKVRLLATALILIISFSVIELITAHLSHSAALRADAGHLLADSIAIALALLASWIAHFPPSARSRFVYRQVEVLAALANGVGLLAMAGLIIWEAIRHLQAPPKEILSLPMLATALIGLAINGFNALWLHRDSQNDLNVQGVFLHVVADAISSVGVILAAVAIWMFNWNWADSIIGLGIGGLIAFSGFPLIQQSLQILFDKKTQHLAFRDIHNCLRNCPKPPSTNLPEIGKVDLMSLVCRYNAPPDS